MADDKTAVLDEEETTSDRSRDGRWDPEILCISRIMRELDALDEFACDRVVAYLDSRYSAIRREV